MANRSPFHHKKKKDAASLNIPRATPGIGHRGLVISNYGQSLIIEDEDGVHRRCTARKRLDHLVCGDRVIWQATVADEGVVVELQARKTLLERPDSHGDMRPIAANIEQLVVVTSPRASDALAQIDTPLETALIDRYLVAAELGGLRSVILINKADLLCDEAAARATQLMENYRAIGYETLFTSVKRHDGIAALIAVLQGRTNVFSGPSGVGKSSLIKAVLPERDIRIGAVSASSGTGRHTTSLATMYHLPHGGSLIDSPGIRDFGLWHADPAAIARGFVEIRHYASSCRFANCHHQQEPGCAVRQAAETGEISPARLASYLHIVESLRVR